jgi:predicted transcriptional regulator
VSAGTYVGVEANVGSTDRLVRIVPGILLVGVGLTGLGNVAGTGMIPAGATLVVGGVPVVATATARRPASRLFGLSTDADRLASLPQEHTTVLPARAVPVVMPGSMREYMQQDMQCEGLLECLHGLKELDKESFHALVDSPEPLTVDEVADRIDRERSTAYRSIQRLLQTGLVKKEQINYEQGGYYHVYSPANVDRIADDMQRLLNDWYAQMGQLIQEFRDKYHAAGESEDRQVTAEH